MAARWPAVGDKSCLIQRVDYESIPICFLFSPFNKQLSVNLSVVAYREKEGSHFLSQWLLAKSHSFRATRGEKCIPMSKRRKKSDAELREERFNGEKTNKPKWRKKQEKKKKEKKKKSPPLQRKRVRERRDGRQKFYHLTSNKILKHSTSEIVKSQTSFLCILLLERLLLESFPLTRFLILRKISVSLSQSHPQHTRRDIFFLFVSFIEYYFMSSTHLLL